MKYPRLIKRLERAVADKKTSERQADAKSGAGDGTFRNIRNGSEPSTSKLAKLATWLGVPLVEAVTLLLEDQGDHVSLIGGGPPTGLDAEILRAAIITVEEWQRLNDRDFDPQSKADAIFATYDLLRDRPNSAPLDLDKFPNVIQLKRR